MQKVCSFESVDSDLNTCRIKLKLYKQDGNDHSTIIHSYDTNTLRLPNHTDAIKYNSMKSPAVVVDKWVDCSLTGRLPRSHPLSPDKTTWVRKSIF